MDHAAPDSRRIEVVRCPGPMEYRAAYGIQVERRRAVEAGRAGNALFLLEHAPVITLGRSTRPGHVLQDPDTLAHMGIALVQTDRGGDVTYHGPGQLVAYPILDLRHWRCSIRWYLRAIEEVLIEVLAAYGLRGERIAGLTGIWVGKDKVGAIGIGVHNWVTFHGLALNVDPDLSHFALVVPCGIAGRGVTSLGKLLGAAPPMDEVMRAFETRFLTAFQSAPNVASDSD